MLLFDSVTRFARAQREIGLAIGEPPATRGYTPSVFDSMPKLLERSGTSDKGSITGIYTILVDGDDMDEPIADTVRGILDGHIVLSRKLAQRYHYPAIDVLKSISRLVGAVTGPVTQKVMGYVRKIMAVYEENEDMITIGAYVKGSNPARRRGHRQARGRRGIPHPGRRGEGAHRRTRSGGSARSRASDTRYPSSTAFADKARTCPGMRPAGRTSSRGPGRRRRRSRGTIRASRGRDEAPPPGEPRREAFPVQPREAPRGPRLRAKVAESRLLEAKRALRPPRGAGADRRLESSRIDEERFPRGGRLAEFRASELYIAAARPRSATGS